jgi:hypothetical protein
VTASGAKSQFIAKGGTGAGAGISLKTELTTNPTLRRNWGIFTEDQIEGDFTIKCSTAAGGEAGVGNTRLAILSNGNVGIGTGNPLQTLTLAGTQMMYNTAGDGNVNTIIGSITSQVRNYGTGIATSSFASIQFATDPTTWFKGDIRFLTNGTDGTSSGGTERVRINSSGDLVVKGSVANISLLGDGVQMHFSRNNTNYIIANGGTSSTIRIISNTNGVELSNGATSWVAVSDENLKEMSEWKPFENSVEKILSLRAGTSRYKTDEEGTSRSFLIAQDVQEVLPEAVSEYEDGTLGLRYTEVIPLLVAAIQELKTEIDSLKNQIK